MKSIRLAVVVALSAAVSASAPDPTLPGIGTAMQEMIGKNAIAGAVTVVVSKDKVLHLETTGFADVAAKRPMSPDTLFWIASMTKPVTGVAILMLQDEGKLTVGDPVAKHLPEFAALKTPSGKPANLTITQILTHTSGLGEATGPAAQQAKTLADLVPLWLAAPMQYEPGERWKYTQSGINAGARIVEVVSGMTFDAFVQKRILRSAGDDEHDVLSDRRTAQPARHGLREEQGDRSARAGAAAASSARAAARLRATAGCIRQRATTRDSAGCF